MEKHEAKCQLLKHMCQPSTTTAYFPVKVRHTYAHSYHCWAVLYQTSKSVIDVYLASFPGSLSGESLGNQSSICALSDSVMDG